MVKGVLSHWYGKRCLIPLILNSIAGHITKVQHHSSSANVTGSNCIVIAGEIVTEAIYSFGSVAAATEIA